jgi:sugar O-acyltransferase (sialic acid O-acetyltransferase NeuD family)
MSRDIVVIGASGHAKVVIDIIEQQGLFKIVGLIDSFKEPGTRLMDYDVIGREESLQELIATDKITGGIIAIGHNWVRHRMAQGIRELAPRFAFVNAIHPSARIAREVTLGHGIAIMAGVSVNPGTRIGEFCFLNTNASVDHDNFLGEFSCLQPNAATGGNVKVGAFSAISIGANIIHDVTIGSHTVIGAGATVLSDVPDCVVAYGSPCRVIRGRKPEDSYY